MPVPQLIKNVNGADTSSFSQTEGSNNASGSEEAVSSSESSKNVSNSAKQQGHEDGIPIDPNVFSFKGRIGQKEFIKIQLFLLVISIIGLSFPIVLLVSFVPILWISLAADVKRIRDIGQRPSSLTWIFLLIMGYSFMLPCILILIYLAFKRSIYESMQLN